MPEIQVRSLAWEDPLEKAMAPHSRALAWKIPWTEEPGGLQSTGSQSRTRLSDFTFTFFCYFPGGSAGKESACNAGDLGSILGLGRSPGGGNGYPLQYSGLENSMDSIVHGVAKSQRRLSGFHFGTSLFLLLSSELTSYCPYFWYSVIFDIQFVPDFTSGNSFMLVSVTILPCSHHFSEGCLVLAPPCPSTSPGLESPLSSGSTPRPADTFLSVIGVYLHVRVAGPPPSLPGCPSSKLRPRLPLLGCPHTPWVLRACAGPVSTWFPPSCWDPDALPGAGCPPRAPAPSL